MMRAWNSFPQLSTIPTSMRLLRHISVKSFVDKWHKREKSFWWKIKWRIFFPYTQYYFSTIFVEFPFQLVSFSYIQPNMKILRGEVWSEKSADELKSLFFSFFSVPSTKDILSKSFSSLPFAAHFLLRLLNNCALLCWAKESFRRKRNISSAFLPSIP